MRGPLSVEVKRLGPQLTTHLHLMIKLGMRTYIHPTRLIGQIYLYLEDTKLLHWKFLYYKFDPKFVICFQVRNIRNRQVEFGVATKTQSVWNCKIAISYNDSLFNDFEVPKKASRQM
jgi:hypothetical protein